MKLFSRHSTPWFIAGGVSALALALGVFGAVKIAALERHVDNLRTTAAVLATALDTNQAAVESVDELVRKAVEGNEQLALALEEEREIRNEIFESAAENSAEVRRQLTLLESEVTTQQQTLAAQDISSIISNWSGSVGRISCSYTLSGGKKATARGSAVANTEGTTPYFLTNKHVVLHNNVLKADECSVSMPNGKTYTVQASRISVSQNTDMATIVLTSDVASFQKLSYCEAVPEVGDDVIILGYPGVGSTKSVTATEGIISGFDEGYYVTSAKIEQGNSGGAAIHVEDNCFIGIPTLVVVGNVESLARILPL